MIFDMTKRKGGGGSAETWGLLETITITEPVRYVRYQIPQTALNGHVYLLELDNVAHSDDFLYVMDGSASFPAIVGQGYMNKSTLTNVNVQALHVNPNFFDGKTTLGTFATTGLSVDRIFTHTTDTPYLYVAMYNPASVLTSGTIRIYGRLT